MKEQDRDNLIINFVCGLPWQIWETTGEVPESIFTDYKSERIRIFASLVPNSPQITLLIGAIQIQPTDDRLGLYYHNVTQKLKQSGADTVGFRKEMIIKNWGI